MTTRVISHDFQNTHPIPQTTQPASGTSLTAAVLAKGRRLAALSNGLNVACVALCGACIGVSVLIITSLILG